MARTAIGELEQQIEQVRRQAFAAGYAAAMEAIRGLASQPAPSTGMPTAPRRRGGRQRVGRRSARTKPTQRRQARATAGRAPRRSAAAARLQRGANAQRIEEVLQAAAPRALRPAEVRKALQEKGVDVSFTSIRHGLSQLEARNAAEQVGDSRSWRPRGGES